MENPSPLSDSEPTCTCGFPVRKWNTTNGHAASCPVWRAEFKRLQQLEADPRARHGKAEKRKPHNREPGA
jgi:hypothetical protein